VQRDKRQNFSGYRKFCIMATNKIIVTGANGQLGRELREISGGYPQWDFIFLTRADLSIEDDAATLAFFEKIRPAYCINCAAYTAVDKAETEKEAAFLINGLAVGSLAAACSRVNARFLHVSTDYVFDGNSSVPLQEGDPTGPVNVYGASKWQGEQLALQHNRETVIIRTSWVYSEFGHNFVKTMIRLMKEKESINVINDQIGSPTYAADLAAVIGQIVTGPVFVPGIYHYSNEGQISWYDFAATIKELTGSVCIVNPIPGSQYPTPAKRPHYSLLDKSLIRSTYGIKIPGWRDSLSVCIGKLHAAGK
jgi:dTDP-4-dehydrorhamnose reductase